MFGEQTFAQLRMGLRRSSRKSSATRSCQRVQYFGVFKQWYGCQSLDFLTSAQMLIHAIAHVSCTDTASELALRLTV